MSLTSVAELKAALRQAGLRPEKGLGQHFLVDAESLAAMVTAGELTRQDTVLEIGPGLGVMTEQLVEQAGQVIAVELDPNLAAVLKHHKPANLEVVQADIRRFDLRQLPTGYKVVANIPYYATAQLVRELLESTNPPNLMALLVQKEVAERVTAQPGQMSVLAFSVQYYAEPAILQAVDKTKFWPAPKVDSAILRLRRRPQPAFAADSAKLFRLIKAGFGERRKMLKNSLAGGLQATTQDAEGVIKGAGLPAAARAQELSLEQWGRLYQAAVSSNLL